MPGKEKNVALAQKVLAGTKKNLSSLSSLMLESGTFTPAQIETSLQTLIDLRTAVDTARAATQARLADEQAQAPLLQSRMAALIAYVRTAFSNSPDVLADFGLTPKKAKTPLTTAQRAAAAAKRTATREARHTMGTKQKKQVKGTITTIVTPSDASKASQPVVAPAPVASAPTTSTSGGATPHGT
jgi:hypothetical protein